MSDPQPLSHDHHIGRFRVVRVLGRGSEGVVYLANDPKLGRDVAIKTSSLGASPDPLLAELLVTTAQTASKLSHPNIVPVFEAGMNAGAPYVVFEYVEGRSLAQILAADGPLTMARAVVMMSQILSGVAQIHERSLIHGDIKPANILVGNDDRARVADFGLLRHEMAADIDQTSGTLRYMAPECFNGGKTDCRRDVYALGLVFYEMLTGRPIIERGTSKEQIDRILNQNPQPPSAVNPRIAHIIDDVVLKALCKDPAQRYQDAAEMKTALDRIRVTTETRDDIAVSEAAVHSTVEFLLRRMAHKSDFPALSASLTSINQISAEGETASIQALSDKIMRDFALTQKLLRLVNSASMAARKVTKVSEAITILGVRHLRTLATSMLLASGANDKKSPGIAIALTDAFVAGLISRNVGRISGIAAVEELFICGMFSPLGELLALYYLPEEYSEIARRVFNSELQIDAATRSVLGISFEELGIAVARHWQFPPLIVNGLSPLPPGPLPAPRGPDERMWHCAVYARELGTLARIHNSEERAAAFETHLARFSTSIKLDARTIREIMSCSIEVAASYTAAAGFPISKTAMLEGMEELCKMQDAPAETEGTAQLPAEELEKTMVVTPGNPPGWGTRLKKAFNSVF